jgi:hypothetical protein
MAAGETTPDCLVGVADGRLAVARVCGVAVTTMVRVTVEAPQPERREAASKSMEPGT